MAKPGSEALPYVLPCGRFVGPGRFLRDMAGSAEQSIILSNADTRALKQVLVVIPIRAGLSLFESITNCERAHVDAAHVSVSLGHEGKEDKQYGKDS